MSARELDLALYGATGFTGRLAARYLATRAPATLRWGLAGRDPARLDALRRELEATACPPAATLQVDATDRAAVEGLARRARVVVSTAGPFARYSDPVVQACVAARADYVDITGETPWVRRLVDRDHAQAA